MSDTTAPRSAPLALRRIRTAPGTLSDWQPLPDTLAQPCPHQPPTPHDADTRSTHADQEGGTPCA